MTFDAGSIEATLRLRRDLWRQDLREAQAEGENFARKKFEAKAEVDDSGVKSTFREIRKGWDDTVRHIGGGGGGGSSGAAAGGGDAFHQGLLRGIGPQILGFGFKPSILAAAGGVGLAALPGLLGPAAALGVGAAGAGTAGLFASELIGSKNKPGQPATQGPLYDAAQTIKETFTQSMRSAAQPLLQPLRQVFNQIPGLLRGLIGPLRELTGGAGTLLEPIIHGIDDLAKDVLPGLGRSFRAAAPLIRPLLDGIGELVKGVLPGLVTLLHASEPAVRVFAGILGTLGRDLGQMFRIMAPAVRASSVVLKAIFDVVGALLPILGSLAKVFASALAPVIVVFAGALHSLLPVLRIIGGVLASFAAAVIKDLAGAFKALASLVKDISPGLRVVANVLKQVFDVLENSGVFAMLGTAIEKTVRPLARLINALLTGLAPVLPEIVTLFSNLVTDGISILVTAIQVLVPIGIQLIRDVLRPLLPTIRSLVPVINTVAKILATGLGDTLRAIAPILSALAPTILYLVIALKAWRIAQAALDLVLEANPIGLVVIAVGALVIAIVELVKHWSSVWRTIRTVARDAWDFIWNGFGKFLLPLLGPVGLIALGAIELAKHWSTIWGGIKQVAKDFYQWLWNDFGQKVFDFLTKSVPHFFSVAVRDIRGAWNDVVSAVEGPINTVIGIINKLINAFDWVSSKLGGPHIPDIPLIGGGGGGGGDNANQSLGATGHRMAAGGRIPGFGGGDVYPALLEPGEAVVDKERTRKFAGVLGAMGVPGFQLGGLFSGIGNFFGKAFDFGKLLFNLASGGIGGIVRELAHLIPSGVGGAVGDLAGLLHGTVNTLEHAAARRLLSLLGGIFGGVGRPAGHGPYGAGVQQWAPIVLRVLRMLGQPAADLGTVLSQMQTESGGRVNAINLWDSNAAAGDPSRGLMQVIMSTFLAYAGPFRGLGIYNPLANIFAALNYAIHRYGAGWTSVLGHGHGYNKGGAILEDIVGVGSQSGTRYQFHAGENVVPAGLDVQLGRLIERLDRVVDRLDKLPARTGASVSDALTRVGRRGAYVSAYRG